MSYNLQKRICNNTLKLLQPVQLRLNFVQTNFLTSSSTLDIRVKSHLNIVNFILQICVGNEKKSSTTCSAFTKNVLSFLIGTSHHLECFNDKISTLVDSKTNSDKVHTDQWSSQYCTNDQLIKKPLP